MRSLKLRTDESLLRYWVAVLRSYLYVNIRVTAAKRLRDERCLRNETKRKKKNPQKMKKT